MLKSEHYKQLNPLSQVPTFKTSNGVLTESAAILQHIGCLDLSKRICYTQGTRDYDLLNQVMSFLTTSLHTSMSPIVHPDRSSDEISCQNAVKQKAINETVPSRFAHVESMFNRHGWLAGDHPTIADAYFYGVGRKGLEFIDVEKNFPKIADFFSRFKSNPAVEFAEAVENETAPKKSTGFKGEVSMTFTTD